MCFSMNLVGNKLCFVNKSYRGWGNDKKIIKMIMMGDYDLNMF